MPSVDELFPEQPKSVDDLFPADIEKNRYRRDTLGTSPIQDLIFGDTSVNPIARVLDAFGQGAKQGWGADPAGLSQESADHMKRLGVFNDYDKGQKSIIKAANESLFRGAAVGVIDPIMRGLPALFGGLQKAVAQTGAETSGTSVDQLSQAVTGRGTELLGREAAGAFEALPTGLRAPTGIPHAAPHPMLAEIERARSLGVIGAGEEGYLGTRPAEVAPPISGPQEAPRVAEAPSVRPAEVAPDAAPTVDAAPTEAKPVSTPEMQAAITNDVTAKLVAAGRPAEEASASAQLIASHYEARAERFGGALGTAEELYKAEGADIRGGKGTAPARSEPIKPEPTGDAGTAVAPVPEMQFDQIKRGAINIREGDVKPVITLFKEANASTFVHETGHAWLEELMKDAEHPKSPASLRDDADAVQRWLGVHSAEDIKTSHHEKFARGFERYMMEGKAPNQALANVFAKFKNWLTKIYQTVTRLKSPINDEVRGVFDRLLTMHPSEVKIEPEGPPKTFADIHETDAQHTKPENAHPVAETIQAERDMLANEHIPEGHDARLENIAAEASRREAGGPQPLRDGNEARLDTREAGNDQASGTVGEGGSNAPAESARPSVGGGKTEVNPDGTFAKVETPLIDKAGNIRLENVNTPEDVLQVLRDSADRNNGFMSERRGVVSDQQALSLSEAMGMDVAYLNTKRIGEAWNKEEIFALENMLIKSANAVYEAMNGTDVLAYADAKARLMMIHDVVQGKASAARAEAGRALQAYAALKKMKGSAEAHDLAAALKEKGGDLTLFQLEREMKLGAQYSTPAQVSKFINETVKPTWQQKLTEVWMSFLLSGIKTHMANIMGNTISGLWRPIETATAATIGKARNIATGSEDRVLFGEAAAELFGMVHGSKEGIVAAYKAYKSEEPQMTSTRQTEQIHPKAIPSATVNLFGKEMEIGGKQLRIPLRLLGAEDEFFKSVAFRGDINRQAYALATKENLPPEQFNVRVAELSMNPTEEMAARAKEVADYQTFQTPLGKVGRSVQNFSNSHILAKLIVPFVRTPINLLKYAGERTPLGLFAQEVRDNLSGKNGAVARDTQVARITLGTMVGVAAFEMASQGLITGGGPADKSKRAIMQADGWQDYSIKVGDMYYRYNRLDPFSVILGFAADAYEINHTLGSDHLDKEHLPTLIFSAISKNILNRASLQGMSDLIQAVNDPERYGKGYIKSMAGTVVPALSAQTAQTLDPIVRDTRTVLDGLKARIPGLSESLMAKRDIWGEPVIREGGLGPDIASPIMERRIKNDPVNQALIAANYFPGKLDRKIRGVELSDQQYDDYQRIAGRMAKTRLNAIVSIPGFSQMPEVTRKELMTNAITTSREASRSLIMMQNPEIIKKATDAKVLKLRGEPAH